MPFASVTDLPPRPIDYLWPGRLARGHLHLVDGDPGIGKSLVLLDLAARLTSGRSLPDGAAAVAPTPAILFNAEDNARDTVAPRLAAAGADLGRVSLWEHAPGEPGFRLPSLAGLLAEELRRTGAGLVVLDPILAFLDPAVNIANDPSVRQALAPLVELAAAFRCAIVLLRHLNKDPGGPALYRGLASIAFVAACRIAWLMGPDPKVPRQYVLAQVKNNLEPPQPSLAYRITGAAGSGPRVDWLGVSSWDEADVLRGAPTRRRARLRAADFLTAALKDGPRPAREVLAAARREGLSPDTLRRAFEEAGVQRQRLRPFQKGQVTY